MAIHRMPDSMSSCNPELYDNIYQVNKRPDLKSAPVEKPGSKDTIQRSLSKDALNRLQQPSKNMILQQSVLFRRVGKYLFLSVALPPYFLLYGLPKWLLVEGLPVLMGGMGWLGNKVLKQVKKPFNAVLKTMKQVLFFMQMAANRLFVPVAQLGIQVKQFFQRMNQRALNVINRWGNKVYGLVKKPRDVASHLMQGVKHKMDEAREWIGDRLKMAHEKIQDGINWVKQSPQIILGWGAAQFQRISQQQANWTQKISSKFQVSKNIAHVCSRFIDRQAQVLKKLFLFGTLPIVKMHQYAIKPVVQFLKKVISGTWNKLSGFLNDRKKRSLEFLQSAQDKIKSWTPQQALERMFSASFLSKLPMLLRKILNRIKQNVFFQILFNMSFQIFKYVLLNLTKGAQETIKAISAAVEMISKVYNAVSEWIKNAFQTSLGYIGEGLKYAKDGWDKGFYGFLVLLFMGGILIMWGFEWLGEITARNMSKISFGTVRR